MSKPYRDERMMPKDQVESPSADDGCSGTLNGGHGVLKKGPWTAAEDAILVDYVKKHGEGNWNAVQKHSGLSRCGKSCRLRWANHLRPNLKKGAFTAEEEQLIIELHARMGNKWARMAAHLPGRTDNEIKNYWNTRIKRRQRAGLPLYPPNLCSQALNENQENNGADELICGNKRCNEQTIDFQNIVYDNMKANQRALSYTPPFQEISMNGLLSLRFGSQQFGFTNLAADCVKRLQESEPLWPVFHGNCTGPRALGLGYPYDPLAGAIPGSHALLNGNLYASKPLTEVMKLELPSLQFPEMDSSGLLAFSSTPPGAVETRVQTPLTSLPVNSDCSSPCNSGLLEELLHEAQVLCSAKNQASEKGSNCSTPMLSGVVEVSTPEFGETGSDDYMGCSLLNDFLPAKMTCGAELVQATTDQFPTLNEGEKESLQPNYSSSDALPGINWLEASSEDAKNQPMLNKALATLLGEDYLQ